MSARGRVGLRHDWWRIGVYLLIVTTINAAVHYPVLGYYPVFDDFGLIQRILDASSFWEFSRAKFLGPEGFYRPAWHVLVYWPIKLSGGSAVVYHGIALLLHLVNAGLVLAIVYALAGEPRAAFVSGLVFALSTAYGIQPLWLAQAPPGMTCLLFAVLCNIRYVRTGSILAYGVAFLLATVATFAYEAYLVAAPLLCLLTIAFGERPPLRKLASCIPYALGVLGYVALYRSLKSYNLEHEWILRSEGVPRFLGYVSVFLVPTQITYPETIEHLEQWWSGLLGATGIAVVPLVIGVGAWGLWRWSQPAGFFFVWTFAGFLPFVFYSPTTDCRYVYLSSVGFAGLAGVCASWILSACERIERTRLRMTFTGTVTAALLFAAGTLAAEARREMGRFSLAGQRGNRLSIIRALDTRALRNGGVLYFYNCPTDIPLRYLQSLVAQTRPDLLASGLVVDCIEFYEPRGPAGYRIGYIYHSEPGCQGCIYAFTPAYVREDDGHATIDWQAVTRNGPLR